jgi:hypothetical protein
LAAPPSVRSARGEDTELVALGVEANWEDRIARYERTAEVRSAEFAEHADDVVLPPADKPAP